MRPLLRQSAIQTIMALPKTALPSGTGKGIVSRAQRPTTAGAYPGFRNMKRTRSIAIPLDGMLVHRWLPPGIIPSLRSWRYCSYKVKFCQRSGQNERRSRDNERRKPRMKGLSELPSPDSRGCAVGFRGFVAYEFLLRAPTRPPATLASTIPGWREAPSKNTTQLSFNELCHSLFILKHFA